MKNYARAIEDLNEAIRLNLNDNWAYSSRSYAINSWIREGRFGSFRKRKVALACYALASMSPDSFNHKRFDAVVRALSTESLNHSDILCLLARCSGELRVNSEEQPLVSLLCHSVESILNSDLMGLNPRDMSNSGELLEMFYRHLTEGQLKEGASRLHCIFWNVSSRRIVDPSWLTSTVLAIARNIDMNHCFDVMPILADALQDASCSDQELLHHCRQAGPHSPGCGVIDLLLDRKPSDIQNERWPYRTKSPAWYAARYAQKMMCLNIEIWADEPQLYSWLRELRSILLQPSLVERYRQELLSPEELAAVRKEQADIEIYGF
jgi:hypothetical protein